MAQSPDNTVPKTRKLVAVVFTDIVGYTTMMGQNEAKALGLLELNRKIQHELAEKYNGELLKEMGDGTLLSFSTPTESIRFALELQKSYLGGPLEKRLRVGIHLGDITTDNKDVFGEGVNIASRLQSVADPGAVYISEDIQRLVRSQGDFEFVDLGQLVLKNVSYPVHSFSLKGEGLPKPGHHKTANQNRTIVISILISITILSTVYFVYSTFFQESNVNSIAVLSFDNISGNPDEDYFAQGMTQTLVATLGKVSALKVIWNTTTNKLKEAAVSNIDIGNELKVDAIIRGSVLREGDMVRITAQMIDARTEELLWVDTYDRDITSILKLHSEVAQAIVNEVSVIATPVELEKLQNAPLVNVEAYDNLLKGYFHLYKINPEHYNIALEYFNKALEIDPESAEAYAGISLVWGHKGQWGRTDPVIAGNNAKEAALKAIELRDDLPMAYLGLSHYYTGFAWDWDEAVKSFDKTISLDPNQPEPRLFLADLLVSLHENEMAYAQIDTAVRLDPLNAFSHCLKGWVLFATHKYDLAILSFDKSLEWEPRITLSHRCLWTIYHKKGEYEKAFEHALSFYRSQDFGETADLMEDIHNEKGYFVALNAGAYHLENLYKEEYVSGMRIARLHTFTNNNKGAIQWLDTAYKQHYTSFFSLNVDPHWQTLHQEKGFEELLTKVNLSLKK